MQKNLYIHIPFCESKCHYCSFTSLKKRELKPYFDALFLDIKEALHKFGVKNKSLQTVFIGGGTPSCVHFSYYEKIFDFLKQFLSEKCEITSEANPNSSTYEWLKAMKEFGVNRLSFGAQSFNEDKLKFLGRIHSKKEILKALDNAKKLNFNNINIDLIYDSKFDDKKMLNYELACVKDLSLSHISAYSLELEGAFTNKIGYKKYSSFLAKYLIKSLENLGFKQYEISNFGKTCKHNLSYWAGVNYIGCGLSSVGFYKDTRFYSTRNLSSYIKNPLLKTEEKLNDEDLLTEHVFLGLRSCVGVDEKRLNDKQKEKAELLTKKKKLKFDKKNARFFNTNYLLSDELALFLLC